MSDWVKTSHFNPETWPQTSGLYWVAVNMSGTAWVGKRVPQDVKLAWWGMTASMQANNIFVEKGSSGVSCVPWKDITHWMPAKLPDLPEAG